MRGKMLSPKALGTPHKKRCKKIVTEEREAEFALQSNKGLNDLASSRRSRVLTRDAIKCLCLSNVI